MDNDETEYLDIPAFLRRQAITYRAHCVFCGWEAVRQSSLDADDCIKVHLDTCEKHPMRKLEAELAEARETIANHEKIKAKLIFQNSEVARLQEEIKGLAHGYKNEKR